LLEPEMKITVSTPAGEPATRLEVVTTRKEKVEGEDKAPEGDR